MNQKLRILIVEDNPADADFVREMLPQAGQLQFLVESASRLSEALARLERKGIDLVLLDLGLPDSRGLPTFHALQKAAPDMPVIVMTGNDDQELATTAMRDGAQDYLVKGQISGSLVRVIQYALERKRAETELKKLNRALRLISLCNQEMVRAVDEPALLQAICRLAVELGGYRMAWVGYAEQDEAKSVRVAAQAGFVEGCLDNLNITWADGEQGRGPTGKAIRTGKPVYTRNMLTDPAFARWRAAATQRGYASSIALPMISEGRCFGALTIYSGEPDVFDSKEIELLAGLANDLAYGIGALRHRAERVRVEEKLRLRESFLSAITENQPGLLWLKDAEGRFLTVNKAFATACGRGEPENVHGLTDLDIWPKELAEKYRHDDQRVMATGNACMVEEMIVIGNSRAWHETFKTPVRDDTGRVIGTTGYARDITGRKQAAVALKENEERFRLAMAGANQGLYDLNLQTGAAVVSPEYARMLGCEPGELAFNTDWWHRHLHPDDREMANRIMGECQQGTRTEYRMEYRLQTKNGGWRWILSIGKVMECDAQGRPLRMLGTHTDITERKRVEEALRHSEATLQGVFNAAPIGICIMKDRLFQSANAYWCESMGYPENSLLGKSPRMLYENDEEHDRVGRELYTCQKEGGIVTTETRLRRSDGAFRDVVLTAAPFRAGDSTAGTVITIHDITEHRKLEAQFRQAQKMEAIGTLAGGVAHDFNNILGVVMGYADLILTSLEPESPLQIYAEEIRHAAEQATSLTRQLLIFSRKQKVEPVVLDLNDAVKELEKMLRRLIGENIEMVVVPGKEIGRIKADAGYIGQVLMNLAVNARDAMPNGGKLTLATANVSFDQDRAGRHPELKPGDYVLLTVSDTGTGMTPEVKARMFEALFTTKPAGKGTGLGLATCQTIVQQSGGHIEVESEAGKGTTFRIYFPRVDKPVAAAGGLGQTGPMPRGTETLLLVEDEASVRQLAWQVLETLGYRVLRANNGQDALNLVREHQGPPIRLVITDVVMPRMGGKEMAEWLKVSYPGIEVLFTSGYTDDAIARQGVLEPGVAFLSKPYTSVALARKVRAMLDDDTDTSILRKLKMAGDQSSLNSA